MFKIEKEGKIKDNWIGRCTECDAIISCKTSDLTDIKFDYIRNTREKFYYVDCIFCNEKKGSVVMYKEGSTSYDQINKMVGK